MLDMQIVLIELALICFIPTGFFMRDVLSNT
jgi:hypothetical protein